MRLSTLVPLVGLLSACSNYDDSDPAALERAAGVIESVTTGNDRMLAYRNKQGMSKEVLDGVAGSRFDIDLLTSVLRDEAGEPFPEGELSVFKVVHAGNQAMDRWRRASSEAAVAVSTTIVDSEGRELAGVEYQGAKSGTYDEKFQMYLVWTDDLISYSSTIDAVYTVAMERLQYYCDLEDGNCHLGHRTWKEKTLYDGSSFSGCEVAYDYRPPYSLFGVGDKVRETVVIEDDDVVEDLGNGDFYSSSEEYCVVTGYWSDEVLGLCD